MYLAIMNICLQQTVHICIESVVLQCVDGIEMTSGDVISHLRLARIALGNDLASCLGIEESVGTQ